MLKKMRWRFILAAMTAVFLMMGSLVAIINFWNYSSTTKRLERVIGEIYAYEQQKGDPTQAEKSERPEPETADRSSPPPLNPPGKPMPEAKYMTRYFAVITDPSGAVNQVSMDFIASVSIEQAAEYSRILVNRNKEAGYYLDYRYRIFFNDDERVIIFLHSGMEQQLMKNLLLISCIVAFLGMFLVFLLVVPFSNRAIAPYMRNIQRQKEFITNAGHEIKTPLTSIAASREILVMEHGEDEWTQNIQKQVDGMSELVNQLILLSRLEEEVPFPQKTRFSLSEIAWETAESFDSSAKMKEIEYSKQIEKSIFLQGNPSYIRQLISILLDNGIKYAKEHGIIRLNVYKKRSKAVIEVFNTCDYLDSDKLKHLFERFYRMEDSRSRAYGGYGIGLSIAQAIVQAHGGKISVSSEDERSICFTVVLSADKAVGK